MSKRQKHGEICHSSEDRISQLPDEILVTILSHVTLREAATTSILSRRWKELWTFTRSLEFDAPDVLVKIVRERDFDHAVDALFKFGRERDSTLLSRKRYMYSIWVNQILKSHKGASIDGFRIRFDMDNSYKSNIDTWINFAIQKSVLRLEVDLKRLYTNPAKYCYPFPKQVLGFPNIKFLRCLLLNYVDVSGSNLEELLSKCPSLEALSVSWSISLVGLKVCGASLKLKFIEIRDCQRLKYVEVSAGNLMALTYSGPNISLCINHAPKLGCMYLGGRYCESKFPLFCEVYTFFSQIETFVLDYGLDMVRCIPEFPQFTILKHLELTVRTTDKDSLLSCISLIKACPMLHRLAVQFEWCSNHRRPRKLEKREGEIKCLKVLEFRWFSGFTTDVELAVSLLENAPNLDKITFDTRNPHDMGPCLKFELDAKRRAAKVCARQLAKKYSPPQAKLLLI